MIKEVKLNPDERMMFHFYNVRIQKIRMIDIKDPAVKGMVKRFKTLCSVAAKVSTNQNAYQLNVKTRDAIADFIVYRIYLNDDIGYKISWTLDNDYLNLEMNAKKNTPNYIKGLKPFYDKFIESFKLMKIVSSVYNRNILKDLSENILVKACQEKMFIQVDEK